mmetsp:Transcript_49883/g.108454  ORF Transcript_49883/g.108454 Transcript_49883/m.108454 type:complete len:329 (+) Transcript_49883:58-1044(+)|eukprot:CAMPEP_0170615998 /NCGR_PEP_ID=MMETSP0224-20130122/25638_1 /TAXON_ID=285029 /ORGANISM="Togula jolla, Strain CCCM 725" /LENGTH=328 /DNA_ID=CAMNT_0010941771 /DNA_START=38 /DNA_END=1024 /DNA_ORIENTATION=+
MPFFLQVAILVAGAVALEAGQLQGLEISAGMDTDSLYLIQMQALGQSAESATMNSSAALSEDGPTSAETIYYQVDCPTSDGNTEKRWFSSNMVMLGKNGLWCPNAKVGTTTVYRALTNIPGWIPLKEGKPTRCYPTTPTSHTAACWYHSKAGDPLMRSVTQMIKHGKGHELCDAFTFTFVRNPWDRLRSAYLEKIASGKFELAGKEPSFSEFVRFVASQEPNTMNMHWRPVATTCLTAGDDEKVARYNKIYRLEDGLNNQLFEALSHTNLNYPKVEEAFMSRPPSILDRVGNYTTGDGLHEKSELVRLVTKTFARDIKMGGYNFRDYP